jgi:carbonic anhydrase
MRFDYYGAPGHGTGVRAGTHMIDNLLEGNKKFRETEFIHHIDCYQNLAKGQSPKILWLGCSDSRVNPERLTGARPGILFIQRNIGNVVPLHDWNFATVLEYAINHLSVTDIVICGHSDCGAIKALDKETDDNYIPLWLNNAMAAKERIDGCEGSPGPACDARERSKKIEQENIRLQIEHLKTYPIVKTTLKKGKIDVHGLYYDLSTGTLSRVT